MSYSTIGPIDPKGDSLTGIIYTLVNTWNVSNPIEKNIIIPSSSTTTNGNINDTILWNTNMWRSYLLKGNDVFLQFEFPNGFIYPTGYSIRGILPSDTHVYQEEWTLFGFNDGEENDVSKWDILAQNSSSEKNFCGGNYYCTSGLQVYTYLINPTSKGFRYLRWKDTACQSTLGYLAFAASGVDIYGTLVTTRLQKNNKIRCTCKNIPKYSNNLFIVFMLTFISCS